MLMQHTDLQKFCFFLVLMIVPLIGMGGNIYILRQSSDYIFILDSLFESVPTDKSIRKVG